MACTRTRSTSLPPSSRCARTPRAASPIVWLGGTRETSTAACAPRARARPASSSTTARRTPTGTSTWGTAFNKILKDLVVRSRAMLGFDAPYVPGWDCHGLPIEHKVDRELGPAKLAMSDLEMRAACREYAERFVGDPARRVPPPRRARHLGRPLPRRCPPATRPTSPPRSAGSWNRACSTASASRSAGAGSAAPRSPRPSSSTSRAATRRSPWPSRPRSPAAVRRAFGAGRQRAGRLRDLDHDARGPCPPTWRSRVHPDAEYGLVRDRQGRRSCSPTTLAPAVLGARPSSRATTAGQRQGRGAPRSDVPPPAAARLARRACRKAPRRSSSCRPTTSRSTPAPGLVHTAPGHGEDDFRTGKVEGIPIVSPLDEGGRYTAEVADLGGPARLRRQPQGHRRARRRGRPARARHRRARVPALLALQEAGDLPRHRAVLHRAHPRRGAARRASTCGARARRDRRRCSGCRRGARPRIARMVENRFEWCVSRQRRWGSPITVLVCANDACHAGLARRRGLARPRDASSPASRSSSRPKGADAWYSRPVADFAPAGLACPKCGGTSVGEGARHPRRLVRLRRLATSRSATTAASRACPGPPTSTSKAHDQYRGWFQSSLLVGVVTHDAAPYRAVVTHGHVSRRRGQEDVEVAGQRRLAARRSSRKYGADVLRLWVVVGRLPRGHAALRGDHDPHRGRLPQDPQHAALPALQPERVRPRARRRGGRPSCARSTRTSSAAPGARASRPRRVRALRVPHRLPRAHQLLRGGPLRDLPRRAQGPPVLLAPDVAGAALGADGAVPHSPACWRPRWRRCSRSPPTRRGSSCPGSTPTPCCSSVSTCSKTSTDDAETGCALREAPGAARGGQQGARDPPPAGRIRQVARGGARAFAERSPRAAPGSRRTWRPAASRSRSSASSRRSSSAARSCASQGVPGRTRGCASASARPTARRARAAGSCSQSRPPRPPRSLRAVPEGRSGARKPDRVMRLSRSILVAAVVVAADQLTKLWVVTTFPFGSETEVVPGLFRLVHTRNRGIAFGILGASGSAVQVALLIVVAAIVGFVAWQLSKAGGDGPAGWGLALVLGGARRQHHRPRGPRRGRGLPGLLPEAGRARAPLVRVQRRRLRDLRGRVPGRPGRADLASEEQTCTRY